MKRSVKLWVSRDVFRAIFSVERYGKGSDWLQMMTCKIERVGALQHPESCSPKDMGGIYFLTGKFFKVLVVG